MWICFISWNVYFLLSQKVQKMQSNIFFHTFNASQGLGHSSSPNTWQSKDKNQILEKLQELSPSHSTALTVGHVLHFLHFILIQLQRRPLTKESVNNWKGTTYSKQLWNWEPLASWQAFQAQPGGLPSQLPPGPIFFSAWGDSYRKWRREPKKEN